ncbi:MAG TPA: MinD/ParA family protein, partial [Chloroflexota bacterium]|nr:MinD/ParA family protein [Chloroflexota bacterium]
NTTANLGYLLAKSGKRIGVIDADIQSPGIHVLFGLDEAHMRYALNDYLWGNCEIEQAAYDIGTSWGNGVTGNLHLIPSRPNAGDIARVLREGYDVARLNQGLQRLIEVLRLDALLIDTHPGLNEETLLSLAVSDTLVVVLRADQQDYMGTSITVEVARKLDVPRIALVVNNVPPVFPIEDVRKHVEQAYGCEVAAVLPHFPELMALASGGIFSLRFPEHPLTSMYRDLGAFVL